MNKIFIIGGNGFIGSAFVRCAQKYKLDYEIIQKENYRDFIGKECDIIINANGNSKKYIADEDPELEFDLSVNSVLRTLFEFKYKKYFFISTVDVYNNVSEPNKNYEDIEIVITEQSNYGFHKYLAELLVKKYAKNWLIFRLGGVVGKNLKKGPVFDLLNNKPLWVDIKSEYQYINSDEVAEIGFALLNKVNSNEIFNICGDGCISLEEIRKYIKNPKEISYSIKNPLKQHYEININKLKSFITVSKTKDTIERFIHQYG